MHPDATPTMTRSRRRHARSLAGSLVLVLLLVACGVSNGGTDTGHSPSPKVLSSEPAPAPTGDVRDEVEVVRAHDDLQVFEQADASSPSRTIAATTSFGSPTALLITERRDGWVRVLVPGRPTGSTAWLPSEGLEIGVVTATIHIDLSERRLTLTEDGTELLETSVAVGSADAPTPTGRFSVTDKLQSPDPAGPYGPFALGLSARSEVLTEFAGGDGQIGIHGTDDPESIGQAVSHGCIRVPNDVIAELNRRLPLGTPVIVEA